MEVEVVSGAPLPPPPLEAVKITLSPDEAIVLMAIIGDRSLHNYKYNGVTIAGLYTALADNLVDSGVLSEPYRTSPNPQAPDMYDVTEQIMRRAR